MVAAEKCWNELDFKFNCTDLQFIIITKYNYLLFFGQNKVFNCIFYVKKGMFVCWVFFRTEWIE